MINNKELFLNKNTLKDHLNDYIEDKPKMKINWVALVLAIVAIGLVPIAYFVHILIYFGALLLIIVAGFLLRSSIDKYKRKYFDYIDCRFKEVAAKQENCFAVSSIYPLFLFLDDEKGIFTLKYCDNIALECNYSEIKNYRIFTTSKEYEANQRLPEMPKMGIKKYLFEVNLLNGECFTLDFSNTNGYYTIYAKNFYQSYSNTLTINNLAKIIDKILVVNKKATK